VVVKKLMMKRDNPLSSKIRWTIIAVAVVLHPILLYHLLPVLGEPTNFLSAVAPIAATLLINWRAGIAAMFLNVVSSACVFNMLTAMDAPEGIPKALFSAGLLSAVCFGAEKLRLYIEQRKAIEVELHQAKKMEAVGRLAGGVAHDINNTLNSIMASVFAHRQELAQYGRSFADLDNIAAACDRGAQLTRNLLGFARKSNYRRQTISVNEVVESVHALLRRTANKNIRIDIRLNKDSPAILGDRAQVESALMNLCINAMDAMADGGTLTLTTGQDADRVSICVEDTGVGMDDDVKERVFEPFFTTKAAGKGTGLGLSMVYGVVHAMFGRIALDSAPGKGTSITLFFPRTTAAPQPVVAPAPTHATPFPNSLSGRTVLLIDDEPLVLRSGVRLLRALGCEVLSAPGGREGADMVKDKNGNIDLVIVDFIMPEMDGVSVIEELQQNFPSVPVILASGYTRESDRLESVRERFGKVAFLAKPYRSEDLMNVAKGLLRPQAAKALPS
jgi:two-component system cell cycle sensor histidine kinase/response regulator CckA